MVLLYMWRKYELIKKVLLPQTGFLSIKVLPCNSNYVLQTIGACLLVRLEVNIKLFRNPMLTQIQKTRGSSPALVLGNKVSYSTEQLCGYKPLQAKDSFKFKTSMIIYYLQFVYASISFINFKLKLIDLAVQWLCNGCAMVTTL